MSSKAHFTINSLTCLGVVATLRWSDSSFLSVELDEKIGED